MSYYNYNPEIHDTFSSAKTYSNNDISCFVDKRINGQLVSNHYNLNSNTQYKLYETNCYEPGIMGQRKLVALPVNQTLTQHDIDKYKIDTFVKSKK
jgi:hypothetical protein